VYWRKKGLTFLFVRNVSSRFVSFAIFSMIIHFLVTIKYYWNRENCNRKNRRRWRSWIYVNAQVARWIFRKIVDAIRCPARSVNITFVGFVWRFWKNLTLTSIIMMSLGLTRVKVGYGRDMTCKMIYNRLGMETIMINFFLF
jgi:hypothetical protein